MATNSGKRVHSLGNQQQQSARVAPLKLGATPVSRQGLTLSSQRISNDAEIPGCLGNQSKDFSATSLF